MELTNSGPGKVLFAETECSPTGTHLGKSLITHQPEMAVVVSYKECLKNHAASLGGHALDGCGEFLPSPSATPTDPTSLKCAACGCHRNFHRRDPYEQPTTALLHYHCHPPPPPAQHHHSSSPSPGPPSSPSPPQSVSSPVPYSYYSSAPQMLLALSTGPSGPLDERHHHPSGFDPTRFRRENPNGRKRSRTKFSSEQKVKMRAFAEKLGWKMQKSDERLVQEFCSEVRITRGVLKVWMHNNKYTIAKKEMGTLSLDDNYNNNIDNKDGNNGNERVSFDTHGYNINSCGNGDSHQNEDSVHPQVSPNGSSSSS